MGAWQKKGLRSNGRILSFLSLIVISCFFPFFSFPSSRVYERVIASTSAATSANGRNRAEQSRGDGAGLMDIEGTAIENDMG